MPVFFDASSHRLSSVVSVSFRMRAASAGGDGRDRLRDRGRHVFRLHQHGNRFALALDFLGAIRRDEAVGHEIARGRRILGEARLCAVVIGQDQAVRRHERPGAAGLEPDDRSLQFLQPRVVEVDVVFLPDRLAREVVRGPHAFIGQDRSGGGEHREDQGNALHGTTVMQTDSRSDRRSAGDSPRASACGRRKKGDAGCRANQKGARRSPCPDRHGEGVTALSARTEIDQRAVLADDEHGNSARLRRYSKRARRQAPSADDTSEKQGRERQQEQRRLELIEPRGMQESA